jgi:hypothetical protein
MRKMTQEPTPSGPAGSTHTSIIYFHGMGQPRRYEEISRLIDSLDRSLSTDEANRQGLLRGQKLGVEPARLGDDDPVTFFVFRRFLVRNGKRTMPAGNYRLYESYWSPAAAGAAAALGVLIWLLGRTLHPLSVLTRRWRAHQRLKRTYLYAMFYDRGRMPALRYRQLAALYREFEGMDARRRFRTGSFADFLAYIADRYPSGALARRDLLDLARRWRRTLIRSQIGLIAVAVTAIATAIGVVTGLIYLVASLLHQAGLDWALVAALAARGGQAPPWLSGLIILALLIVAVGTGRFFRQYLSDVVFWTTTLEKDVRHRKRREIVKAAEATVRHVLADPDCDRIVVIGHSLGTAIAYETLISLGRRWRADRDSGVNPSAFEALGKVSHFISLGSPIDRISYFFHTTFSRYHRYNRVADELRGRSSDLPFRDGPLRIIEWINVRDKADPIASRLFSPRGPLPNRDEIHEVEVASGHFPSPSAAHIGYFESRRVAKLLVDASILGRESLQLHSARPGWSETLATMLRFAVWGLAVLFSWAIAVGGAGYIAASPAVMWAAQLAGLGAAALIALAWTAARIADRMHDLRLPA